MCGIAGIYSPCLQPTALQNYIAQMTRSLAHRGPDAEGLLVDADRGIALGHRRLSILDLSDAAKQPFVSACGRYVMTYNGEVYNYRDLRQRFGLNNLRTTSDTEIIIELFALYGAACVQYFNGMFAIAIYDRQTECLWLLRDRIGVKPLYYTWQPESRLFGFASELKAFQQSPLFAPTLSVRHEAIALFLNVGFMPGTTTIYQQIQQLPPAHYACYNGQQLNLTRYWSAADYLPHTNRSTSLADARQTLDDLLRSAVTYRLISDVPVGIFLSGGIDSSLVAATAQEVSGQRVQTFSIGFAESQFDESSYARAVAQHIGSKHHEFRLSYTDALDRITQLADIYDEPFADSSALPMLLVSEMARRQVSVALSGDGGDELFLGYGMYRWATRLANPISRGLGSLIGRCLQYTPHNRYRRGGMVLDCRNYKHVQSHILSQESYLFARHELNQYFSLPRLSDEAFALPSAPIIKSIDAASAQAFFDLHYYLPNDLLVKTDRASMHHALEVRNPLLDYRIVEFALGLPASLKYRKGTSKYLLKQVLYQKVPAALFDRPKRGFAVPLAQWLKTELRSWLDDSLQPDCIAQAGFVAPESVKLWQTQFYTQGRDYLYNRLWALAILHRFWRRGIGQTA